MTGILARVRRWLSPVADKPSKTENRRKHEERRAIIAAYGAYLEQDPPVGEIREATTLPFPKHQILEAMYLEIALSESESEADAMMSAAQMLVEFQDGVGERPVTELGAEFKAASGQGLSMKETDLLALAASIANNPDRDRYEELKARADAELIQIRTKLMAADTMRRSMPTEKKRSLRS